MRRIIFLAIIFLLINSLAVANNLLLVTEFDAGDRDPATDIIIGEAEINASVLYSNGVRLQASPGDNMATIRLLVEADKSAKSLRIIINYKGHGWLSVVDVSRSKQEQVIATNFDLFQKNRREAVFDLASAYKYVNSKGFVEIHISVSDGQELEVGHIAVESLAEPEPRVREIVRYRSFPSTHYRRTIFTYIYRGPIIRYVDSYEYVVYDYWWELPSYRAWVRIYRPRVVEIYPTTRIYFYQEPVVIVRHPIYSHTVIHEYVRTRRVTRSSYSQSRVYLSAKNYNSVRAISTQKRRFVKKQNRDNSRLRFSTQKAQINNSVSASKQKSDFRFYSNHSSLLARRQNTAKKRIFASRVNSASRTKARSDNSPKWHTDYLTAPSRFSSQTTKTRRISTRDSVKSSISQFKASVKNISRSYGSAKQRLAPSRVQPRPTRSYSAKKRIITRKKVAPTRSSKSSDDDEKKKTSSSGKIRRIRKR